MECSSWKVVGSEMFMGEYRHSLDTKGRLIVPAKFRDGLGEAFVITRGLDNCLFVYPQEEWKALEEKVKKLPLAKSEARAFVRFLFSGASECEVDKQGRISLPTLLRDYARIDKEVVVIGVSNRVEIWSKENWETYINQAEIDYADLTEKIVELGI